MGNTARFSFSDTIAGRLIFIYDNIAEMCAKKYEKSFSLPQNNFGRTIKFETSRTIDCSIVCAEIWMGGEFSDSCQLTFSFGVCGEGEEIRSGPSYAIAFTNFVWLRTPLASRKFYHSYFDGDHHHLTSNSSAIKFY